MKNKEVGAAESRMHYGFVIVACCCLMMGVCVGLTFSCAGIFYKPVSESLGVPVGEFGIYMSVMYITSTLMLSVAGNMIEKYSARKLFAGNAAVMGLTSGSATPTPSMSMSRTSSRPTPMSITTCSAAPCL